MPKLEALSMDRMSHTRWLNWGADLSLGMLLLTFLESSPLVYLFLFFSLPLSPSLSLFASLSLCLALLSGTGAKPTLWKIGKTLPSLGGSPKPQASCIWSGLLGEGPSVTIRALTYGYLTRTLLMGGHCLKEKHS